MCDVRGQLGQTCHQESSYDALTVNVPIDNNPSEGRDDRNRQEENEILG